MNAVEIEEAVSDLAGAPFDPQAFPYAFLTAFGMKDATIARLRKGDTNASDVGGVLQRSNIHIAVAMPGGVGDTLRALRESPKTTAAKAKFILATDGDTLEAEDLISGEPLACPYPEFAEHFGFFLPLAGISTVKELKNNPIDVKATGRLNRLYVELLKENPDWGSPERRHDLNQFMARLIFCYFAEDTGIFNGTNLFTSTIERMSTTDAGSVEHVLTELFRAMDTAPEKRSGAKLRSWADVFPWVNGGLFAGGKPCPKFSKIGRSYLLRAGELNWQEINPDIFGSMIQAVADDGERGSLGMHYTSVPNIMKVLGPLFLDDLRAQLEVAGNNVRKLRNLRKRLASIRVFDPACGSGNFLVIAYIRMREIEHELVKLTNDEPRSVIPLENFYGIEIKDFAAEIARLALLIAEFQCDVRFIDQHIARSLVLPLKKTGQIKTGNALTENWIEICPPVAPIFEEHDLAGPTGRFAFDNEQGHSTVITYICGNPPYSGSKWQTENQKSDLVTAFLGRSDLSKSLDYVSGWFIKAAQYGNVVASSAAFVSTNSICQGQQVSLLWPSIFATGAEIDFAHMSFKWANLASRQAVVTVIIIGFSKNTRKERKIYELTTGDDLSVRVVPHINAYLVPYRNIVVEPAREPQNGMPEMLFGNMPRDAGHLLLSEAEKSLLESEYPEAKPFLKKFQGSEDFTNGKYRGCIWVDETMYKKAACISPIEKRFVAVAEARRISSAASTRSFSQKPYRFVQIQGVAQKHSIIIPRHSSEAREYLPAGINTADVIIADSALAIYDAPLWALSLIISRIHLVWIATVCGKIKSDYRYANTLGWNTFPVPILTEKNKDDLTKMVEKILVSREAHFPMSITEMYDPHRMPSDLRKAHVENDEVVERIYIGRTFKNDTERLEKLFQLYETMVANVSGPVLRNTNKRQGAKSGLLI